MWVCEGVMVQNVVLLKECQNEHCSVRVMSTDLQCRCM